MSGRWKPQAGRIVGSVVQAHRTLGLVWRASPPATIALLFLNIASALMPVLIAYAGKLIVDAIVAAGAAPQRSDRALLTVLTWIALELALVILLAITERAATVANQVVGERLAVDVNVLILDKALTLGLSHFEDASVYDKLTRARAEASTRPLSLIQQQVQVLRAALTAISYVVVIYRLGGWVILALISASVPAFIGEARFSAIVFHARKLRSTDRRLLDYLMQLATDDRHCKEVKLFRLGGMLRERYLVVAERVYREAVGLAVRRGVWTFVLSLAGTVTFYGFYAMVAIRAARGIISLGDLTLYVLAFRQGQQAFQALLFALGRLNEDSLYMSNLFEFLGIPTDAPPSGRIAPRRAEGVVPRLAEEGLAEEGIRFEGVSFRYPGAPAWALAEVSLFIPRGQHLALVGANGAGKTTFIKLLTRLYEPSEGRILLDGRDIRDYGLDALHRRLGVVFQDFCRYQFVLRDNVGVGCVEAIANGPRIERALARAGARRLVASLPHGLDTQLGRWFKDGVELSGGQWQTVALARAFMHEEADVLILDEPTAALDAHAENAVFERFRMLAGGRTAILISHRFPTIRIADRVVLIEQGRIVEDGTHAELVARGEQYAQLFELQAQAYR